MINWRKTFSYGLCIFISQVTIGIAVGFFFSDTGPPFHAGDIASSLVALAIFAHLAKRQIDRPLWHGCLALVVYCVLSILFGAAIWHLVGGVPISEIALEWLGLALAMLVGVGLGLVLRRKAAVPGEA